LVLVLQLLLILLACLLRQHSFERHWLQQPLRQHARLWACLGCRTSWVRRATTSTGPHSRLASTHGPKAILALTQHMFCQRHTSVC
jgi:hypothetical protein